MLNEIGTIALLVLMTFALLFALLLLVSRLLTFYDLPDEFHFENRPSLVFLYAKALAASLFRRQGDFAVRSSRESTDVDSLITKALGKGARQQQNNNNNKHKHATPLQKVVCLDCRLDREVLAKYARLSGYAADIPVDFVPPCFLESLFLPLILCLVVSDDFKLSPLGLIHISQTITQHTSLSHLLREPCDLECSVAGYRFTARGVEVDLSLGVYDRRQLCVWAAVTTLLSRDKEAQRAGGARRPPQTTDTAPAPSVSAPLPVPADMGRQFASVSGDWNPHHLWGWTARLLGFRRPIAHGMWTLSRCLTWAESTGKVSLALPFRVDARFKRPLSLPGVSTMALLPAINKDRLGFRVHDATSGEPQLEGTISTDV